MLPQTWEQLGIWLATQFPVLGSAAFLVWWVLRWNGDRHAEEIKRFEQNKQSLLAEKDVRISERDRRIDELKAEATDLRAKLTRQRRVKPDAGGGNLP